nr:unnamed protein product [Digitaria exilis]
MAWREAAVKQPGARKKGMITSGDAPFRRLIELASYGSSLPLLFSGSRAALLQREGSGEGEQGEVVGMS